MHLNNIGAALTTCLELHLRISEVAGDAAAYGRSDVPTQRDVEYVEGFMGRSLSPREIGRLDQIFASEYAHWLTHYHPEEGAVP